LSFIRNHIFLFITAWQILVWLGPSWSQVPHIQKVRFNIPDQDHTFSAAVQDGNGFIWLGSDEGLFRFDGQNLKKYHLLPDSVDFRVLSLFEAPDRTIWIGCKDGSIYHLSVDGFSRFAPEEGKAGKGISDIVSDKDGVIWWSTLGEGIYFYFGGRVYNINHEDGLRDNYIYDLMDDSYGRVWAGTDGGVAVCSRDGSSKSVIIPDWNTELPDPIIKVLDADPIGNIYLGFYESTPWFISEDGNKIIDPYPGQEWNYGPVSDLVAMKDELWVSTGTGRLIDFGHNGVNEICASDASGIPGNGFGKIHELLEDHEGNVWIFAASGVYRTTGSKLRFYDRMGDIQLQNIHAIHYERKERNHIWFSTDKGLFRTGFENPEPKMYLDGSSFENLKITCLNEDPYGFIWAGTFNYGVFRIDPVKGHWTHITEKEGLVNNNVLSISIHVDTLWLATLGGATEINLGGDLPGAIRDIRSYNRSNGLVSNYIYSIYEDKKNRIWFATDGDGISVLDHGKFFTYNETNGLGDDVIYSISGDRYGNIWIATATAGVYRFDGTQFRHYGIEEGLGSLEVAGLKTSGDEVLILLDDGLDVLHIPSGRIIHYGDEIGLGEISPDLNVISRMDDGSLWIGTRKGIIRYRPGFDDRSSRPVTVLEQVAVFLEPVPMTEHLLLGSNENHISFTYAGLWLSHPEKVNYQVMLEGFDLGWKNTYDPVTQYSSLPPGKYTFRVRSSTDNSFQNASEATFNFTIKEPFWTNLWFILMMAFFILLMTYLLVKSRERKLKRIEQQKKEKVEFEFQLLKNQVNPHFLFNSFSTLMALIEEQPKQAMEFTEKLSDFFRIILQLKDEEVITVREELQIVEDYFYLLKRRYGANLSLDLNIAESLKETYLPPMTMQILIENAVKHNIISKDKPLKIRIYSSGSEIIVENNVQLKLVPEISTGIGLENIIKRYRLISEKEPVIEKNPESFRIRLPLTVLH